MKRLLGLTRYVVLLGVGGSLFAAATLFLSGFLQIGTIGALGVQALASPKRLTGVVVTVLAVTFLGIAAEWTGDDILSFGLAVAAVIISLGVFGWLARGGEGRR